MKEITPDDTLCLRMSITLQNDFIEGGHKKTKPGSLRLLSGTTGNKTKILLK